MTEGLEALAARAAEPVLRVVERSERPCIVAVDGRSGVGKSTLAAVLAKRLDAALIATDDFFAGGLEASDDSAERLADICIDRAALRAVLARFKAGEPASYAAFDWQAFDGSRRAEPTSVAPGPLLIVEGVYANHPELRAFIDVSIRIDVAEATRERRLLAREGRLTDWERGWRRAEDWYFHTLAPDETFHRVVRND